MAEITIEDNRAVIRLPYRGGEKPPGFKITYAGGNYPAGSVIAAHLKIGGLDRQVVLFNPAEEKTRVALKRLSKQRQVILVLLPHQPHLPGREPIRLERHQGDMQRRELAKLLEQAQKHRPARRVWEEVVQSYHQDGAL